MSESDCASAVMSGTPAPAGDARVAVSGSAPPAGEESYRTRAANRRASFLSQRRSMRVSLGGDDRPPQEAAQTLERAGVALKQRPGLSDVGGEESQW